MRSRRLAWRRRPPLPELMDDAIAEILLRLPPDDPGCLVRASLVCKLWHRILSEPTFPDRYREFHGTPPLLGFLSGSYTSGHDETAGRFIPMATTKIRFRHPVFGCRPLDCRHGRVLLDKTDRKDRILGCLAVWDPVTGYHNELSDPGPGLATADPSGRAAAVLCATAAGCNHHDHRGCAHAGGPFQVLFVSITVYNHSTVAAARAWVYSSRTAAWSLPASVQIDGYEMILRKRAAIVGDQLYFLLSPGAGILKYDLGRRSLAVIGSPCTYTYTQPCILITMEDSSLGLVVGDKDGYYSTTLHLWRATEVNPNGSMGWVHDRVISLNNLLPTTMLSNQEVNVVGFAEGVDILFLSVGQARSRRGIMVELKSGQIRKLSNPVSCYYGDYFPYYLSFYIPE